MTKSLDEVMRDFNPPLPLAVAFSGGADSTALLVACAEKWPGHVVAWHINHGLQSAALFFEQHCSAVCRALQVPLYVKTVNAFPVSGQSPEDAARNARYGAFDALSLLNTTEYAIKSIAIAQHADDQVETVLLALSRGAGLAGLSGMAAKWHRGGLGYYRPLLAVSRQEIGRWLTLRGQTFIEDPSNQDERYTRNRIRARLLPVLEQVFPAFRDTFSRSAVHAAQAQSLLDEIGQQDCRLVCGDCVDTGPRIKALQALSRARQANVLRHWLKSRFAAIPSTAQLAELLDQLAACTTRAHQIHLKIAQGYVTRVGRDLTWYNP